jgi:ubiquinone/menaquinone biosynthesis C-methylase UbiE
MQIPFTNPHTQEVLTDKGEFLQDSAGKKFVRLNEIPRFVEADNYTENFGFQWNTFVQTQIDRYSSTHSQSKERFFAVTGWDKQDLTGQNMLEVGSGAGRFSQVVLDNTNANLYSVDYSNAVEANWKNNTLHTQSGRFVLAQASIYELPFPKKSFDKVFCFGVLQHTPDFKQSVKCLTEMVKPGGELIVDFYPIRGWWTKIHAKYIFRPFTKRMSHPKLLKRIERNANWLIGASQFFNRIGVGKLTNRFLPICDIKSTLPPNLSREQRREWVILDTFDMFSPEYDHPQRLATVKKWFEEFGMKNVEAGFVQYENSNQVAAVRGIAP